MHIIFTILKAMAIGITGSIPVGPIVLFSLHRCVSNGRKAGMACASGAIISDTIFSVIAVFAFSAMADFLESNTGIFKIIGGLIIIGVGLSMCFKKMDRIQNKISRSRIALDALKSIVMGLSNPGCLLWILAMFAAFHIDPHTLPRYMSLLIVIGVCAGSLLYWLVFTRIAAKGKRLVNFEILMKINRYFGILIALFGIYFFVSGINMTFRLLSLNF